MALLYQLSYLGKKHKYVSTDTIALALLYCQASAGRKPEGLTN